MGAEQSFFAQPVANLAKQSITISKLYTADNGHFVPV
jgi:hypothetical protein